MNFPLFVKNWSFENPKLRTWKKKKSFFKHPWHRPWNHVSEKNFQHRYRGRGSKHNATPVFFFFFGFTMFCHCWWLKSCTTKDDDYPIIYRVLTIPRGAGFQPSTVGFLLCPENPWGKSILIFCCNYRVSHWWVDRLTPLRAKSVKTTPPKYGEPLPETNKSP